MLFNSYIFIFAFLPFVWCVFQALKAWSIRRDSARIATLTKAFLVLASLFFYAYWKLIYLPLLLVSILINYLCARAILHARALSDARSSKLGFLAHNVEFNGGGGER